MNDPTRAPAAGAAPSPRPLAARFPDDIEAPRHHTRAVRAGIAVLVVVTLAVIGLYATGAFASGTPSYRTATAGRHDVDAVISGVGMLEPVSQATVAFPVSGTVATVSVKPGDTVTAGQQLATLDTQSLTATLHDKEASLAQAKLTLTKARNGEAVTPGGTGGARTASATTGSASSTGIVLAAATIGASAVSPQVAQAQQAVLDAQQHVDTTLAAADTAMADADTVCADAGVGTTTTSTTTPAAGDPVAACKQALDAVKSAQSDVAAAQKQLASASSQLDALLSQQAAASPSGSGTTGGTPTTGSVPSGSAGSSPSAADLVKYQKAVDAAAAEVIAAQQAVSQATIVSPIAGTVAAVNLASGDEVTAGSTSQNIVIAGPGGYEVSTNLSVDDIAKVSVGQQAVVHLDGAGTALTGKVVSISAVPSSTSSSSTTTYRVTVTLDHTKVDLRDGMTATVDIITGHADAAVAVPTSAVTANGSRHTVTVLDNGEKKTVSVTVGVVGETWTEISQGIRAGQTVVLATLSEPLPDSATSSSNSSSGTPTFPGGGRFPGFGSR